MALMVMTLKVAGTMVAGWRVFGLVPEKGADRGEGSAAPVRATQRPAAGTMAGSPQTSPAPQRAIAVSAIPTSAPANENPSGGPAQVHGTGKVLATASGGVQVSPLNSTTGRARGIGSRFRAPAPRPTEKFK
jgi:type IV secretion system protein VirB6